MKALHNLSRTTIVKLFNPHWREILILFILTLPFLTQVILMLQAEIKALNQISFVLDDVWIHLQFAKNLAQHLSFSFNLGEPIAASTAPLYTLMLAVNLLLTSNITIAILSITIFFSVGTIIMTYFATKELTNSRLIAIIASFMVSANSWTTWSALSGMEISVGAFLLITSLFTYLRLSNTSSNKQIVTPILLGLLTLIRPESYVFVLLYFSAQLIQTFRDSNRQLANFRFLLILLTGFIVVVLPYGLFSYVTTGSIFPNTYSAKVGELGGLNLITQGLPINTLLPQIQRLIANYFTDFTKAINEISPLLGITLIPGIVLSIYASVRDRKPEYSVTPIALIAFIIMVGFVIPSDRISWPWNRHMLYLIPLLFTLVSFLIHLFYQELRSPIVRTIAICVVILLVGLNIHSKFNTVSKFYIDRTGAVVNEHLALSHWIDVNIANDKRIAASDIGVLGYVTGNYIIDTEGLINSNIKSFKYRRNSPEKDLEINAYLNQEKPAYLVKFTWVYPSLDPTQYILLKQFGSLAIYQTPWTNN